MVIIAPVADGKLYEWEIDGAPTLSRDVNETERQNARLRCTIEALGELSSYTMGLSAALGIALCPLVGDEFAKARHLITSAILKEVDSLNAASGS